MADRETPQQDTPSQYLPVLLLLFVGSGCAALIYEVVWFQLLQLVIGSSAISLGVLLGTFMGGMCLGSFLLPRYINPNQHPMRVYAVLELGIGVMGLVLLFGMPLINGIYTSIGGGYVAVRAIVAAICLLPPTLLMGATLPAIARWVEATPRGVAWMGFFYGGNILGAVIGSLLAGFYLLRVHDMGVATYVAVFLNATVAVIGLLVAKSSPYAGREREDKAPVAVSGARIVYLVIGISGFTALSAQVLWTRLLSLMFGATVYTFALILGVFLFGLGIGSSIGAALSRSGANARVALGWCQMLLAGALAWAAYMLTASLPYWPINPSISSDPWFNFQLDIVRCMWVVLPGAILWGASFPLALASIAERGQDPGRLVGGVYAANTLGAIIGSLAAGLVMVTYFGTQQAQMILIVVSAIGGLMMLAPAVAGEGAKGRVQWTGTVALVAATFAAGLLARNVPQIPGLLIAYGRYMATWIGSAPTIIYQGEGLNAFVAVSQTVVRRAQLSQRRQSAGVERAAGHAPAADARTHDAHGAGVAEACAGHRLRRRGHGGSRGDWPGRRARDDRRDRAARAGRRLDLFRRAQLRRRQQSQGQDPYR